MKNAPIRPYCQDFFNWSRSLAVAVIGGIADALKSMAGGLVDYLPSLAVIIVVLFIARFLIHLLRLVFKGINKKRISFPGFYPEWSRTSFNLLRIVVIALTLVVIPVLYGLVHREV